MGSEMCIRDSAIADRIPTLSISAISQEDIPNDFPKPNRLDVRSCLLYTSDAADERSSVDLGGRRIIKKKNRYRSGGWADAVRQMITIDKRCDGAMT